MAKIIHKIIDTRAILEAIILVFSETNYLLIAFILATLMAFTYPLLFPIVVGAEKISIFAFRGGLFDILVLTSVSVLFGMTVSMQLYHFKRMSTEYKKTTAYKKATGATLMSTIAGMVTSKACCLVPLLLLMIGATAGISFFIKYTTEIRLVGLAVLTFSLYWTSISIANTAECCKTREV